jgi:hypothetical protein
MKNLWIVYSSRKGGHKYPTESIVNYLEKYHNKVKNGFRSSLKRVKG